jgi:ankyrin repeat protein
VNAPPGYNYGRTALQVATSCETPNMELIQLLIDNNANIHAAAGVTGGITALQGAAIRGHIKIALMLLQMGADVNARPAIKEGRTAIEGAAEHGRLDIVQLLLNSGAKGDVIRKTGFKMAIELAEKNRNFAIAQLLRAQQEKDGESSNN